MPKPPIPPIPMGMLMPIADEPTDIPPGPGPAAAPGPLCAAFARTELWSLESESDHLAREA